LIHSIEQEVTSRYYFTGGRRLRKSNMQSVKEQVSFFELSISYVIIFSQFEIILASRASSEGKIRLKIGTVVEVIKIAIVLIIYPTE